MAIFDLAKKWSTDRNPSRTADSVNVNVKTFAKEPEITKRNWTDAYEWKKLAKVKHCQIPNTYYMSSSDGQPIETIEIIKEYERQMATQSWQTFKSFIDCTFGIWKVVMVRDDWLQSSCTCPVY